MCPKQGYLMSKKLQIELKDTQLSHLIEPTKPFLFIVRVKVTFCQVQYPNITKPV
jgi:hypothetical protein